MLSRFGNFYSTYVLFIVTVGYIIGELGHYLIGVTSKQTAIDLEYGDITCQQNNTDISRIDIPVPCESAMEENNCYLLKLNDTGYCEWNYNGLGIDYQILAGPAFILVFTTAGVFMGFAADKFNRTRILMICTFVYTVAIILQGSVTQYWQLVILRMVMAAGESGCNPLATGILSDMFPENKRALVMAVFNWGIYGGYGIAFPVGRYITNANIFDLGWRICYYGVGIVGLLFAVLIGTTLREPERKSITGSEEQSSNSNEKTSIWYVIRQPVMLMLMFAASIRHCGGMTFAYNADLYYNTYFPDVDLAWWLFVVTIGVGSIGVVVGGLVSDKIVANRGVRSRALVLAFSQLLATVPAFGSVYFDPLYAMISLGCSYFFAEMWFGIVFALVVEIVPLGVRSATIGLFLFAMNNIGGNLPVLVDPVAKKIGYRGSLMIFYAGFYGISSVLFLITFCMVDKKKKTDIKQPDPEKFKHITPYDNAVFSGDDTLTYTNSIEIPFKKDGTGQQHFYPTLPATSRGEMSKF